ncbi:hypothetical protein [Streptomyces violaceorubidus]|uniref:hypothetical protein n=1 Tax=Streptomyces violaceorubidus TaxID=284042 RepID=UPI000ADE7F97|nr:hypothetical protein [Streptomyces violaceorubidus]
MSGTVLRSDTRVREAARDIGIRYGVDYTDDAAVTALLAERRKALEAEQRRPAAWLGLLALMAGLFLPFGLPLSPALDAHLFALLGAAAGLTVVGTALLVHARTQWKRALHGGPLAGYREILGIARAHGIPLAHIPPWLEGRTTSGGGKGAAPIPTYPPVEPAPEAPAEPTPTLSPSPSTTATPSVPVPVPVPPKPWAVSYYEQTADAGGWHDETGCLLLLAGAGGVTWAATVGTGVGYAALLLVPLAAWVWLAGRRQGREKEELREEALKYVKELEAAQAAGARVPELSPQLRALLDGHQ